MAPLSTSKSSSGNRIPLCEPSPIDNINPRLPRVGDRFETWDDFRTWSRRAAEARGFTLSQSQSKGSSGTIVLRCSRFKEPGAVGQRMAENGCEVVFKVMNARNGGEGFEVVHAVEEHNHPFGPDIPTGHRVGTPLSGQPPKKKKAKTAVSAATQEPVASASATPPASNSKPFKYDPYTGKPLRSSTTPMPSASTPSPPTHLDHQPTQPTNTNTTTTTTTTTTARPISRGPSSVHGTPRSHSSRPGSRTSSYPHPNTIPQQQEAYPGNLAPATQTPIMININPEPSHNNGGSNHATTKNYGGGPGLSIRLSLKAQTSITEFLTSLSPSLTSYGNHFKWIGIHSPFDLLEIIDSHGEEELDVFLDEIDTCGIGRRGEGLSFDEKFLIFRGLHKLSSFKK